MREICVGTRLFANKKSRARRVPDVLHAVQWSMADQRVSKVPIAQKMGS